MAILKQVWRFLIGPPHDPLHPETRQNTLLIPFLAWVGVGANSLSSSCYGPEKAFLALGTHTHLAPYLAIATLVSVFIISLAYNQVIELFPSGGGGYKVVTRLLGPHFGLACGAAMLVDYILTMAISIASGMDTLFSLLPVGAQTYKLKLEVGLTLLLMVLNLRGVKASITLLIPIFLGFLLSHILLIGYGIIAQADRLSVLIPSALQETHQLSQTRGWIVIAALFLRAYVLGGATYTGVETVSNNIHLMAEPQIKTGKMTVLYMVLSLSVIASGLILLYVLWQVQAVPAQTLNATVFQAIIGTFNIGPWGNQGLLLLVLALEGGLLLVAANSIFFNGPTVLANMAADSWIPHQFRNLSSRLVRQNGIFLIGVSALAILLWSKGQVAVLVVFYSINVFLSFSLSKFGLCLHWWRSRAEMDNWLRRLLVSLAGLAITATVLVGTLVEKFTEGGWTTVLVTGLVIGLCWLIRKHYDETREQLCKADELFIPQPGRKGGLPAPELNPARPTAIILVTENRGAGMHALLWVQRLFPNHFNNFIFLSVGEVDSQSFRGQETLQALQSRICNALRFYTDFCHSHGLAATAYVAYGTDPVIELENLAKKVMQEFPHSVCFANKLIFPADKWFTRWLHDQTALVLQARLHLDGKQMVILPMKVA